jgi:hypothetical protein
MGPVHNRQQILGWWYMFNFGWCFVLCLLQVFKYTACVSLTGCLQRYSLVRRSFKVTATAAGTVCVGLTGCLQRYSLVRRSFKVTATAAGAHALFLMAFGGRIFPLVLVCSCFKDSVYSALWWIIMFVAVVFKYFNKEK